MLNLWRKIRRIFSHEEEINPLSLKEAFNKIKAENKTRDARINKLFTRLNSHFLQSQTNNKAIKTLEKLVAGHGDTIQDLTIKMADINQNQATNRLNSRLIEPDNRLIATNRETDPVQNKVALSMQEKKILAVLFDNAGVSLSYKDIAKLMGKSEITVKTQINQLKNKTNVLKETTDPEGKKRYNLKENVKLEKFVM